MNGTVIHMGTLRGKSFGRQKRAIGPHVVLPETASNQQKLELM